MQRFYAAFFQFLDMACGETLAGLNYHGTLSCSDVEVEFLPPHPFAHQFDLGRLGMQRNLILVEEQAQYLFVRVVQRLQNHSARQLAASVDADEQQILLIELEVQPRAPVGDHPSIE